MNVRRFAIAGIGAVALTTSLGTNAFAARGGDGGNARAITSEQGGFSFPLSVSGHGRRGGTVHACNGNVVGACKSGDASGGGGGGNAKVGGGGNAGPASASAHGGAGGNGGNAGQNVRRR